MKYLLLCALVLLPVTSFAQVEIVDLPLFIAEQAKAYGVDVQQALYISYTESHWNTEAIGDTQLICKSTGKPMKSRGIWQWNTCGHPDISDEQAFDLVTSTQLAMREMALHGCGIWTSCPSK